MNPVIQSAEVIFTDGAPTSLTVAWNEPFGTAEADFDDGVAVINIPQDPNEPASETVTPFATVTYALSAK